jgi:response regulator RpfG family c-di-GMP phosphodiesterase
MYLSPQHIYITWFTRKLNHGYIKILATRREFLPHGDWWTVALKLIVDYFISFVRIVTQARTIRYMARKVAYHIGKVLEDTGLEPKGHMAFMKKTGPLMGKHIWGNIPEDFIYGLYLHDIGKLMLTGKERQNSGTDINKHVALGSQLIKATGLDYMTHLANMVKYHHEKALGGGPFGLKGSEIPREAEIVGMLCHFHHLIAKGLTIEEALRVIHSYSPSHYSMFAVDLLKPLSEVLKDGH